MEAYQPSCSNRFEGMRRDATNPEDSSRLEHLSHERRHSLQLTVACADSSEDAVENRELSFGRRHEAADLRHECDHADLRDDQRNDQIRSSSERNYSEEERRTCRM